MKKLFSQLYGFIFGNYADIILDQNVPADRKPEKIKKREKYIIDFFAPAFHNTSSETVYTALQKMQATKLINILFNKKEDPLRFISDDELATSYDFMNNQYRYFNALSNRGWRINQYLFMRLVQIIRFIENFFELTRTVQSNTIAYKMLVLFGDTDEKIFLKNIDKYIDTLNLGNSTHSFHDAFAFVQLPIIENKIDLASWRQLITKHGKLAIKYFECAEKIEAHLGAAPTTLEEAQIAFTRTKYQRSEENLELNHICIEHNISEEIFNECLNVLSAWKKEIAQKQSDNLPDIHINGAVLGYPKYHLVKLPIGDYHALILGKITNCCQSITGDSEQCVIDGITLKNNGFYVLLKEKPDQQFNFPVKDKNGKINYQYYDIVGQGYTWRGAYHTLVIDSWESKHTDAYDAIAITFLKKMGDVVTANPDDPAHAMMIGIGGRTPQAIGPICLFNDSMLEGNQYSDSQEQICIQVNKNKQQAYINQLHDSINKILNKQGYISGYDFTQLFRLGVFANDITFVNTIIIADANNPENWIFEQIFHSQLIKTYLNAVVNILKKTPELLLSQAKYAERLLLYVAENGHADCLKLLIKNKVMPRAHLHGETALMLATDSGSAECVSVLIQLAEVDLNETFTNKTALIIAIEKNYKECINILLQAYFARNVKIKDGGVALRIATEQNDIESLKSLLKMGIDVDATNIAGRTALMQAAKYGHAESVKVLLAAKADPNKTTYYSPLMLATKSNSELTMKLLINAGAAVNFQHTGTGETALILAAKEGNLATLRLLLAAGAKIDMHNNENQTAVLLAAENGFASCVALLVRAGANLNFQNKNGETALMRAVDGDHPQCCEELIKGKVNINMQDSYEGYTALMKAVCKGSLSCIQILLSAKANINIKDEDGNTALIYAIKNNGRKEKTRLIVNMLLKHYADINHVNNFGWSALLFAAKEGDEKLFKMLLYAGANPNQKNNHHQTVEMLAPPGCKKILADRKAQMSVPSLFNEKQNTLNINQNTQYINKHFESDKNLKM